MKSPFAKLGVSRRFKEGLGARGAIALPGTRMAVKVITKELGMMREM